MFGFRGVYEIRFEAWLYEKSVKLIYPRKLTKVKIILLPRFYLCYL